MIIEHADLPGRADPTAAQPEPRPARLALSVRGLDRTFGATRVLTGVGLDVHPGRVVALVGPSGCGKTTLVRLVAGFDRPDRGEVLLAGRAVDVDPADPTRPSVHVPPDQRRVGVVPQEGALFPHLDVAGNVGFGLRRGGRTPQGRSRIAHLLALVGLDGLGSRRPDQLSGGQQQRVAVARALAPSPDLMLLDEPFSALDATLRTSVRDSVMAALRAEAASVLLVTHDQDEALGISDVLAVMLHGQIAQVGPPHEVYARPASAEVATFLGGATLLPGDADGATVRCELGTLALAEPAHGRVTVLVRPEQLALLAAGSEHGGTHPGTTHGVVASVSFHGHDALVALRTPNGTAVEARLLGGWLPRPGQRVGLGVRGPVWALPG